MVVVLRDRWSECYGAVQLRTSDTTIGRKGHLGPCLQFREPKGSLRGTSAHLLLFSGAGPPGEVVVLAYVSSTAREEFAEVVPPERRQALQLILRLERRLQHVGTLCESWWGYLRRW